MKATDARFGFGFDVAAHPDGSVWIADCNNHRVRRLGADGFVRTMAGDGVGLITGDGGPAAAAQVACPLGIEVGPDGSVYFVDDFVVIRRIGTDGIIRRIAGALVFRVPGRTDIINGVDREAGSDAEGIDALEARLSPEWGLAVGPDSSVYVAADYRVRRIGPDGTIRTIAGTGVPGTGADGVPATTSATGQLNEVEVGPDGSVYWTEHNPDRVRKVGPDGIVRTVAGTGTRGFSGDGGQATLARLDDPLDVAAGPDGSVSIMDSNNFRVRQVTPDGVINTVAGAGDSYEFAEGTPAAQFQISAAYGIDLASDGAIIVADTYSSAIRRIGGMLPARAGGAHIPDVDGSVVHVFDRTGRHIQTRSTADGTATLTFGYDAGGRITTLTDYYGLVTTIERAGNGEPTGIIAPFGQRTALTLDVNGWLSVVTPPDGRAIGLQARADGLLEHVVSPAGDAWVLTYDEEGKLSSALEPDGGQLSLARTRLGPGLERIDLSTSATRGAQILVAIAPDGTTTREITEGDGLTVRIVETSKGELETTWPNGEVHLTQRSPAPRFGMVAPYENLSVTSYAVGREVEIENSRAVLDDGDADPLTVAQVKDTWSFYAPGGQLLRRQTTVYDGLARTLTRTTRRGDEVTVAFDDHGNVIGIDDPRAASMGMTRDPLGRITAIGQVGPTARDLHFAYDPTTGFLASATDALGQSSFFESDAVGRATRVTMPDAASIAWTFDARGDMATLTPPGRPAHAFTHDAGGRVREYRPPGVSPGLGWRMAYDDERRLTQVNVPGRAPIVLSYDAQGRPVKLQFDERTRAYTYDPATGQMRSVDASPVGLAFTHDGGTMLTSTWAGPIVGTVGATYDSSQRLSAVTVNGQALAALAYDAEEALAGAGAVVLARGATSPKIDRVTAGAVDEVFTFDAFDDVSEVRVVVAADEVFALAVERDARARISRLDERSGGVTTRRAIVYDTRGRITRIERDGSVELTLVYDENGNRTSIGDGATTLAATYDDRDRVQSSGDATYTWADDGSLDTKTTAAGTTRYGYDALGALRTVQLPDGTDIEYLIDGLGRRVGRRVDGALTHGWLYWGHQLVAELDASGAIVKRFVFASRPDLPDLMLSAGRTFRIVGDHAGSPRRVIDIATGEVVEAIDRDPFGNVLVDTNPGLLPFGFGGGLADDATGLVRLGARDYDPTLGRFTAMDPALFDGGNTNLYVYLGGDPVNDVDPSGLGPAKNGRAEAREDMKPFFDGLVADMVAGRRKVLGGGKPNNIVAALSASANFLTGGLIPTYGSGCVEHADEALNAFAKRFPGWRFYTRREENGLLGHQYVEGEQNVVGEDGESYKIVIDTWAADGGGSLNLYRNGRLTDILGGHRKGHPAPLATGVTLDPWVVKR